MEVGLRVVHGWQEAWIVVAVQDTVYAIYA